MEELVGLVAAGLAQIVLVDGLDHRVLMALPDGHALVLLVEGGGPEGGDVGEGADVGGLDGLEMCIRDSKCVLCRRCVSVCRATQEVGVIGCNDRGFATHIGCAFDRDLSEVDCVSCGQCIVACPTGALSEKDDTGKVWAALNDPTKHVVVGPAPSVRVTLGEC